jgi:hypothetical protein
MRKEAPLRVSMNRRRESIRDAHRNLRANS